MAYNGGRGQDYGGGHPMQDLPAGGSGVCLLHHNSLSNPFAEPLDSIICHLTSRTTTPVDTS